MQPKDQRIQLSLRHTLSVERKLATALFVDLVGSTALLAGTDPEVARRRVTTFFELVSKIIESHGGTVEKFAGDAVMAVFGVPLAHEDDAERALRAAFDIRSSVDGLELQCRIGVEAGEVVYEDTDSTLATGKAVNLAARLQQLAEPGEILVGEGVQRLVASVVELEHAGRQSLRGFVEPLPVWRAVSAVKRSDRGLGPPTVPLIGRDVELALLRNTFERTVRDRRAHLVTIYGEPGVGKSRLARDFIAGLDDVTVLVGRSLPYGEGITYWPLAEMVKAWAGIVDDDSAEQARQKLLAACPDEAIVDLLALAAGVVEGAGGDRSRQEIAWAAREWAERVAALQPLVLAFEDVHWSEEPLRELIEHLASSVRDAPLLILCLARPELLEADPDWGGGRTRGASIELGALTRGDAEELVDALLADGGVSAAIRDAVLDKTEGNPLFVEETVRMLAEGTDGSVQIPDTVQALIAARIDALPRASKTVLQRAAVIGRVFWQGALEHVSTDIENVGDVLEALVDRDFLLREQRSSISAEQAFRFKHILIREIAYSGLTKSARAELHAEFADWLHGRGVEELVEIRAYHLDQAVRLLTELEGTSPPGLAAKAARALEAAGTRALAREANRSGRRLLVRAVELEPTLERRYQAARAAWRLNDIPAVTVEMERVRAEAKEAGDRRIEGRALITLGEVVAFRDSDTPGSRRIIEEGLALLDPDDLVGRIDALWQLHMLAKWVGDVTGSRRYAQEMLDASRELGRKDLMSWATNALANTYLWEIELDRAEELAIEAARLAEESGGIVPRGDALNILANVAELRGDADEGATLNERAIALFAEAGAVLDQGRSLNHLAELVMKQGDDDRAERLAREAVRLLKPLGDRGYLCESQRILAQVLVRKGKVDEAERFALEAVETVGPEDVTSLATTQMALGLVRAAQGRHDEAEALLRGAVDRAAEAPDWIRATTTGELARYLRMQGRGQEAAALEARIEPPVRVG
jgi:class 3 adenylate cyclase/tetratricopeptide (TPR) repeat protein